MGRRGNVPVPALTCTLRLEMLWTPPWKESCTTRISGLKRTIWPTHSYEPLHCTLYLHINKCLSENFL
eukprot:UN1114